jgi:hypothetical protein
VVFFFFTGLVSSSSSFHLCVEAIIWQKKDYKQIPKKLICGVQMGILSTYTVSRFLQISSSSKQIWCFCSRMYVCWGRRGGTHKSHFCNWHRVASSNSQQHSCVWGWRRNCKPQFSKLYMNRIPFFTLSKRACNRYMWKKWLLIDIIELIAATTSICCNPL